MHRCDHFSGREGPFLLNKGSVPPAVPEPLDGQVSQFRSGGPNRSQSIGQNAVKKQVPWSLK